MSSSFPATIHLLLGKLLLVTLIVGFVVVHYKVWEALLCGSEGSMTEYNFNVGTNNFVLQLYYGSGVEETCVCVHECMHMCVCVCVCGRGGGGGGGGGGGELM